MIQYYQLVKIDFNSIMTSGFDDASAIAARGITIYSKLSNQNQGIFIIFYRLFHTHNIAIIKIQFQKFKILIQTSFENLKT